MARISMRNVLKSSVSEYFDLYLVFCLTAVTITMSIEFLSLVWVVMALF